METYNCGRINKAGKFCAKYTFILGSLILILFCFTGIRELRIMGFIYFAIAVFVNLLMMFILFVHLLIYPKQYMDLLKTAAIILFNLPVAVFYLWLAEEVQHTIFQITTISS